MVEYQSQAGVDASEEANFSEILLQLGEGKLPIVGEHTVNFPPHLGQIVCDIEELKNTVFPDLTRRYTDTDWLSQRAILSPINENVNKINENLLNQIPGEEIMCQSIDSAITDDESITYPMEFLNSLNRSSLIPMWS